MDPSAGDEPHFFWGKHVLLCSFFFHLDLKSGTKVLDVLILLWYEGESHLSWGPNLETPNG